MLKPSNLHPYQVKAYKDIIRDKSFCITDDCGGGKTICGLSAAVVLLRKRPTTKMLVVCTPTGVKEAWSKEYLKWSHTKHLRVAVLNGTPTERLKLLRQNDHDIYAISYNSLQWLVNNNDDITFTYVFADEADCLKGVKSKWRKYLLQAAPKATHRILATATPKARDEDDYWGVTKYLDNGKALGTPTISAFRAKYCDSYSLPQSNRILYPIRKSMIPELEKRIRKLFRNYGEATAVKIPIKTVTCKVSLKPESQSKYDELLKTQCVNSIVYTATGIRDEKRSLDPMTLSGKLNQLTSGFLYVDENLRITPDQLAATTDIEKLIHQSKKRQVAEIFDDRILAFKKLIKKVKKIHGDIPLVITYTLKHELDQLQKLLPTAVSDKEDDIDDRWNNNEIPYLLLQYSRSSKSRNLQYSKGYVMLMYSSTFKWVDDYQIVKRLARQGQVAPLVYVYRLHLRKTLDDLKARKLSDRFVGHRRFQDTIVQNITQ